MNLAALEQSHQLAPRMQVAGEKRRRAGGWLETGYHGPLFIGRLKPLDFAGDHVPFAGGFGPGGQDFAAIGGERQLAGIDNGHGPHAKAEALEGKRRPELPPLGTMIQIDVQQAQTQLLQYLEQVSRGETILVCKDHEPIAEIRPVAKARKAPRPIGLAKGTFEIPANFFEPLPDDLLAAFQGQGEGQ